jgi:hypothetical protein
MNKAALSALMSATGENPMFSFIRNSALSALICLGGFIATPQFASAQSVQGQIGPDGMRRVIVRDCSGRDRNSPGCRAYRDRHERRDHRRDERYGRDERGPRLCTPERALDKAERMGVRRARIVDVGRRTINVAGRAEGRRIMVTFSRERGCPVIR